MTEEALEPQSRQRRDARDEVHGVDRVRIDAAAMKADVDLDQDVDLPAGRAHHPRPAARDVEVVDDEGEMRAIEQ